MADVFERVYDLAFAEVEKISKKDELTKESLCVLKDVVDIVKDIGEIMRQEYDRDEMMGGYSGRGGYSSRMGRYNDGNSYARGYNNGNSSRRYGRYNSYDDGRGYMMEHLEMAMDKASSDSERNMIRQLMDKMNNQ